MIFIFTEATVYGEFVEVVQAADEADARKHLNGSATRADRYDLAATITGDEPEGLLWAGGGDVG